MPEVMVVRDRPVAWETRVIPPRGRASASEAAQCRHMRSVIVEDNNANFSRKASRIPVVPMTPS